MAGFDDVRAAPTPSGRIVAAGIVPAGLEMMDGPALRAAEAFAHCGYPLDATALLLCELDGLEHDVDAPAARGRSAAARLRRHQRCGSPRTRPSERGCGRAASRPSRRSAGSRRTTTAWTARSRAATSRACSSASRAMSREAGLPVANVFHAGDGNLHPLILFDAGRPDELERAERLGAEILELCVAVGGTVTGEHGVGVEKLGPMCTQFGAAELEAFHAIKRVVRPDGPAEPRQGRADAGALRRLRCDARARRQAAVLPPAPLLTDDGPRRHRSTGRPGPRGDGTRHAAPDRGRATPSASTVAPVAGELLETRGHSGIVSHDPAELVLTARGGTPLAEVEAQLASKRAATAVRAAAFRRRRRRSAAPSPAGSPVRHVHGPEPLRDYVLGARVLTGDGRVLRFGGEVMKNVAGYDVARLMAGSLGILGVLLDVSLKVLPRPAARAHARARGRPGRGTRSIRSTWPQCPAPVGRQLGGRAALPALRGLVTQRSTSVERRVGGEVVPDADAFWTSLREQTHPFFAGALPAVALHRAVARSAAASRWRAADGMERPAALVPLRARRAALRSRRGSRRARDVLPASTGRCRCVRAARTSRSCACTATSSGSSIRRASSIPAGCTRTCSHARPPRRRTRRTPHAATRRRRCSATASIAGSACRPAPPIA